MRIVLFAHPSFTSSRSMPRFTQMLAHAYAARGHDVQLWAPRAVLFDKFGPSLSKWAGYIDQYVLFPAWVRGQLQQTTTDTLFVLTDQALGPWVPLVRDRPHVVHVHDLLALRSALGEIARNPTRVSGRLYQRYIRRGFAQAQHFICISQRTRDDLLRVGGVRPQTCEVVHNGLNQRFEPVPHGAALARLRDAGLPAPDEGMLLHVSGSQWYKNVDGVVRIYAHYARREANPSPLWLVGVRRSGALRDALAEVPGNGAVCIVDHVSHELLVAAYSVARALLFPSHAEGFGWPIVEAQACGCPVITTDDAPMNEIGGPEARYLPLLDIGDDADAWAAQSATVLQQLLAVPTQEQARRRAACIAWAGRFDTDTAIESYLRIYERVLAESLVTRQRSAAGSR